MRAEFGAPQLAAAILKHLAGDRVHVRSAGSKPAGAVRSTVVEALDEIGVDRQRVPEAPDRRGRVGPPTSSSPWAAATRSGVPGRRYLDWELDDLAGQPLSRGPGDPRRHRATRPALLDELGIVRNSSHAAASGSPPSATYPGTGRRPRPAARARPRPPPGRDRGRAAGRAREPRARPRTASSTSTCGPPPHSRASRASIAPATSSHASSRRARRARRGTRGRCGASRARSRSRRRPSHVAAGSGRRRDGSRVRASCGRRVVRRPRARRRCVRRPLRPLARVRRAPRGRRPTPLGLERLVAAQRDHDESVAQGHRPAASATIRPSASMSSRWVEALRAARCGRTRGTGASSRLRQKAIAFALRPWIRRPFGDRIEPIAGVREPSSSAITGDRMSRADVCGTGVRGAAMSEDRRYRGATRSPCAAPCSHGRAGVDMARVACDDGTRCGAARAPLDLCADASARGVRLGRPRFGRDRPAAEPVPGVRVATRGAVPVGLARARSANGGSASCPTARSPTAGSTSSTTCATAIASRSARRPNPRQRVASLPHDEVLAFERGGRLPSNGGMRSSPAPHRRHRVVRVARGARRSRGRAERGRRRPVGAVRSVGEPPGRAPRVTASSRSARHDAPSCRGHGQCSCVRSPERSIAWSGIGSPQSGQVGAVVGFGASS